MQFSADENVKLISPIDAGIDESMSNLLEEIKERMKVLGFYKAYEKDAWGTLSVIAKNQTENLRTIHQFCEAVRAKDDSHFAKPWVKPAIRRYLESARKTE